MGGLQPPNEMRISCGPRAHAPTNLRFISRTTESVARWELRACPRCRLQAGLGGAYGPEESTSIGFPLLR